MSAPVDTSPIEREAHDNPPITTGLNEALAARLDKVDLLLADLGQASEFTAKAVKFADEAATEIRWNRIARALTLSVVLLIICGLARILFIILQWPDFQNLRANPIALSTALAAIIGGGVILATGVSKSVLSNFADRNGGMPMPDHLKVVIDGIGSIFKQN